MQIVAKPPWYWLWDSPEIDSPALLIYPDRLEQNIDHLLAIAGGPDRLRPHVKTHKMAPVVARHLARGIRRFKCATIAEAEMLAAAGAADVLLAYQPVGPRITRLVSLAAHYPAVRFGCLVDDEAVLRQIAAACAAAQVELAVWLDLDNGMGRTGIQPGVPAADLYRQMADLPGIYPGGFHVYDGHLRQSDFEDRRAASDAAFAAVEALREELLAEGLSVPAVVAGGSPTFPVHARRAGVDLSPGTYVFWDAGYGALCPDLPFAPAAVLLTRVISKPGAGRLCLDLGHKAVAAENPLSHRVRFLNAPEVNFAGQSEEHLVVEVPDAARHRIGEAWYGVPWHICPTVALYQEALIVENNRVVATWPIAARSRRLQF